MVLKPVIVKALNDQLNREYSASYIYLAISAYFETINYQGFAAWMRHHSSEEMVHMMKIYRYLFDRDSEVEFQKVAKPPKTFPSILKALDYAYEQEKLITLHIHNLVALANKEKAFAVLQFLQWFLEEQVEEEQEVLSIIKKVELMKVSSSKSVMGLDPAALMILDKTLGESES